MRSRQIERVYVVLAPDDERWGSYDWDAFAPTLVPLFCGGAERFESVRNGLRAIQDEVAAEDWVLVHDAARPCLSEEALDRLIAEVGADAVGGLLAVPVADTLKRADAGKPRRCTPSPATDCGRRRRRRCSAMGLAAARLVSAGRRSADRRGAGDGAMGLKPRLVRATAAISR